MLLHAALAVGGIAPQTPRPSARRRKSRSSTWDRAVAEGHPKSCGGYNVLARSGRAVGDGSAR